jgi:hypothetical protein
VGFLRSQSIIIVLYPTDAIDNARLNAIKLFPSLGWEEVIRIIFDFSCLSFKNRLLLRFLNDSVIADFGASVTTASL